MSQRVTIHRLGVYPVLLFSILYILLAACSQEESVQDDYSNVSLRVVALASPQTGDAGAVTLPKEETDIYDLSIFIFNNRGKLMTYKSETFNTPTNHNQVNITTSAAQGCTLYVVANAIKLSADGKTSPLAHVNSIVGFKQAVLTLNAEKLKQHACLLMVDQKSNFNTQDISNKTVQLKLKRLASKLQFTIKVETHQPSSCPIVVDSYQLCNMPNSSFFQHDDFLAPTMPATVAYSDDQVKNVTGAAPYSYSNYVYTNTNVTDKVTFLKINAHCQADPSNSSTKIWESEFQIKLQKDAAHKFLILPNHRYLVTVTIKGGADTSDNTVYVITSYKAYPYFSNGSLDPWGDETPGVDFTIEEKFYFTGGTLKKWDGENIEIDLDK